MKGGTLIFFRPVLAPAKGGKQWSNVKLVCEAPKMKKFVPAFK
jgi:hypothetical protein